MIVDLYIIYLHRTTVSLVMLSISIMNWIHQMFDTCCMYPFSGIMIRVHSWKSIFTDITSISFIHLYFTLFLLLLLLCYLCVADCWITKIGQAIDIERKKKKLPFFCPPYAILNPMIINHVNKRKRLRKNEEKKGTKLFFFT